MSLRPPRKRYLWVWLLCLVAFYGVWLWLVSGDGVWDMAKSNWPIALAMALGSFAAGSTPMGGGTVGFPVLVLMFDQPAGLGRDFSFAVQSIGMTSATIFILARRQPLAYAMLKGAIAGSLIGTPLGIFCIAPFLSDLWIKIIFAVIWASFGLLHLYRMREIAGHIGMTEFDEHWDLRVGFILGVLSAATAVSVTGVGIDMVLYATLVLLCRADLKFAIPTSVVIMALTSILGITVKALSGDIHPGVYENWLAAAPVVALGAPLGVFIVEMIGRRLILLFVAVLCVGQFVWTCFNEWTALGVAGVTAALVAVGGCLLVFEKLRAWGGVLVGEQKEKNRARMVADQPGGA